MQGKMVGRKEVCKVSQIQSKLYHRRARKYEKFIKTFQLTVEAWSNNSKGPILYVVLDREKAV